VGRVVDVAVDTVAGKIAVTAMSSHVPSLLRILRVREAILTDIEHLAAELRFG
jgi:hypothetical protein